MNDLNKLNVVEDKAFSNVIGRAGDEGLFDTGCFSLYLSNCGSLRSIEEGAFDATTLCMLDISKNNLTSLSRTLLDWKSLPEGANLQFNPWHCSCELQWLLDDLLPQMYRANSRLLTELRCGSPRAYEGLRLVHWYNWTEQAMCNDDLSMRSGPYGTYMVEESTEGLPKVTSLTLILGGCIIVALLVAIALVVYLVRTRRRHRIRQAALNRKRQSAADAKNTNGTEKEQFSALNKA
ncbi:jg4060 [Pararge aegeria aegeria]|uniref:Jg4060 protein n=3 Tax=Pararge aegeria TaxID=116150 RepID=A0A8S4R981_9NEOP|nr:jg4060 [Pararge aegeria aegeria]